MVLAGRNAARQGKPAAKPLGAPLVKVRSRAAVERLPVRRPQIG